LYYGLINDVGVSQDRIEKSESVRAIRTTFCIFASSTTSFRFLMFFTYEQKASFLKGGGAPLAA